MIDLTEVGEEKRPVLEQLAQLYMYDFTEHAHGDVADDGRFPYIDFDDFFERPVRHGYLIRVDGKLAGFALAYEDRAFRDPNEKTWWMDEFFVMRKYRKRGVGEQVATRLFDTLRGTWEIGQVPTNVDAQAFWRRIIDRYTGGDYEEFELDDDRWRGPVQYFRTGAQR